MRRAGSVVAAALSFAAVFVATEADGVTLKVDQVRHSPGFVHRGFAEQ